MKRAAALAVSVAALFSAPTVLAQGDVNAAERAAAVASMPVLFGVKPISEVESPDRIIIRAYPWAYYDTATLIEISGTPGGGGMLHIRRPDFVRLADVDSGWPIDSTTFQVFARDLRAVLDQPDDLDPNCAADFGIWTEVNIGGEATGFDGLGCGLDRQGRIGRLVVELAKSEIPGCSDIGPWPGGPAAAWKDIYFGMIHDLMSWCAMLGGEPQAAAEVMAIHVADRFEREGAKTALDHMGVQSRLSIGGYEDSVGPDAARAILEELGLGQLPRSSLASSVGLSAAEVRTTGMLEFVGMVREFNLEAEFEQLWRRLPDGGWRLAEWTISAPQPVDLSGDELEQAYYDHRFDLERQMGRGQ